MALDIQGSPPNWTRFGRPSRSQIGFFQVKFPREERALALRPEGLLRARLRPHRGARAVEVSPLLHFPISLRLNHRLVPNCVTFLEPGGSDGLVRSAKDCLCGEDGSQQQSPKPSSHNYIALELLLKLLDHQISAVDHLIWSDSSYSATFLTRPLPHRHDLGLG
ncbi:hypothetical protein ACFX13_021439 [Malus domestica]